MARYWLFVGCFSMFCCGLVCCVGWKFWRDGFAVWLLMVWRGGGVDFYD